MTAGQDKLLSILTGILSEYQQAFADKAYSDENNDHDVLMDVFGITPELKRENRQYWGRELGMCWQRLVIEVCRNKCKEFKPALRFGADEPCDLVVSNIAIDTKYRIGSGDSGTLKKFKAYGPLLKEKGFTPALLIIRTDNLPAAITACKAGGWVVYTGAATFKYLQELTGFNVLGFLEERAQTHQVDRS